MGARLVEADHLDLLWAAGDFDSMRLGAIALSKLDASTKLRSCSLCQQEVASISHILAECTALVQFRDDFLKRVDPDWSVQLRLAVWGDWPAAVLNPHLSLSRLIESVRFVSSIVQQPEPR